MPRAGDEAVIEALAGECADAALAGGIHVGAAESLTSGAIASALGKAHDASEWFAGSIVAYESATKFRVLDVDPGPVVTARAAEQMATGALAALGCDVVVAVTGAGGPEPEDGRPVGTVFVASGRGGGIRVDEHRFDGEPADVVQQTVEAALRALLDVLRPRS
ncbi:nicotinamide-nucleotide amidohydrolase family protein [Agromyces sp. CFH 90414]|uniref:Nicotinamide-nucleotide amidohydrolase family protein n=1 Tax=Agromyces agglutinans TaxID=2662258 RepID=A0A6I2F491_9MICO|nr:CinA family protein [Agromyces agglutinans]MRG59051.1 nicotinamide-nucleotide amidohydrolase family protein [Agromyces agglutinans]